MPQAPHVFIAHAHEDKFDIVTPLAIELKRRGLRVWYDEFSLQAGDSLIESINRGIKEAEYGIVVFSPIFFTKGWATNELTALIQRQINEGKTIIRPIYHNVTDRDIRIESPMLADIIGLSTKSQTIPQIVDKLISSFDLSRVLNINQEFVTTGSIVLNRLLGGGIPRRTSIVVLGPVGIGKTTLGMQIQIEALKRGEPCLYITYKEHPSDIIRRMIHMGAPILDYIAKGNFKVLDNFSSINHISEEEVVRNIPLKWKNGIIRVSNPEDVESYYKIQIELMEEMGLGGINIVDSTNERFKLLQNDSNDSIQISKYFQRFKARLASLGGQSAIHIATETEDIGFSELLENIQDGIIRMKFKSESDRSRFLRIEKYRNIPHDESWHQFIVVNKGLEIY